MTIDTYIHVTPGIQEAAAKRFDDLITFDAAEGVKEDRTLSLR